MNRFCSKCGSPLRRVNTTPPPGKIKLHAYDCPKCHSRTWVEEGL